VAIDFYPVYFPGGREVSIGLDCGLSLMQATCPCRQAAWRGRQCGNTATKPCLWLKSGRTYTACRCSFLLRLQVQAAVCDEQVLRPVRDGRQPCIATLVSTTHLFVSRDAVLNSSDQANVQPVKGGCARKTADNASTIKIAGSTNGVIIFSMNDPGSDIPCPLL